MHQTTWTVAWLWLLCFDKNIFACNSTMKVKLKILVLIIFNALLDFEVCLACSGAELNYITLLFLLRM